jgi:hypothetical protein
LRAKELVYVNEQPFQGPGTKAILLAIIRHGSLPILGGGVLLSSGLFFSLPRCALRKARKVDRRSNIPPMLAAQAAFRSEPLPGFHKKFDYIRDDPNK